MTLFRVTCAVDVCGARDSEKVACAEVEYVCSGSVEVYIVCSSSYAVSKTGFRVWGFG